MLKRNQGADDFAVPCTLVFARQSGGGPGGSARGAKISTRASTRKIGRHEADQVYQAIQKTKISAPATDCISPIGEELILKGLAPGGAGRVLRGRHAAAGSLSRPTPSRSKWAWPTAALRRCSVSRGKRWSKCSKRATARTMRQFLLTTFQGLGSDGAERILTEAHQGTRVSPGRLKPADVDRLFAAMHSVNLSDGQTMSLLRYANRVPLQFQAGACAITQAVASTNWRAYGLTQSRGSLPSGPITVMIHMASVWVPFTSESKEAVAGYPEIQKELRLALQAVGRKLGMFLRRRNRVKHEGQRRQIFLRYLGEVAGAVSGHQQCGSKSSFTSGCWKWPSGGPSRPTCGWMDRGRPIEEDDEGRFRQARAHRRTARGGQRPGRQSNRREGGGREEEMMARKDSGAGGRKGTVPFLWPPATKIGTVPHNPSP